MNRIRLRILPLCLALWALLLATAPALRGQNNPFDIEDQCYDLFRQAEIALGTPAFDAVNQALLDRALAVGDTKAETLYYVEQLKQLTRLVREQRTSDEAYDRQVDNAQATLKEVARRYGYDQYFFYSYELAQSYYYNHNKPLRTIELIQEMQDIALAENNEYGLWSSYRYMVSLYVAQNDYLSSKKYVLAAIDLYERSQQPALKRQSLCRLYCDLADTYDIGADSVRINIAKAVQVAKQSLDTLRCHYHLAKLTALDRQLDDYAVHRDACLQNPLIYQISPTALKLFGIIDAIVEGTFDEQQTLAEIKGIQRHREVKYIANIAETYGFQDFAFLIEKQLVKTLEAHLSERNTTQLSELDARMGNARLNADLARASQKMTRISRLVILLLALILLVTLAFSVLQIRSLRHNKAKDAQQIADLQAANEKVRLADAAKTRFVQNMSHEVRTPLNAIVGFSQLLSLPDGSFPPEEKDEFAGHIVNNTKMLTMLLDDILNASAMDAGNYQINYEDGEMHFMAQAAISSSEHRLQPGVRMSYAPAETEPFTFRTDPRRVQQIIINLLTNACKHTREGEIILTSSLTENPGYVTYAVTDTGPGVPADQAEKIFDRFTKLNDFVQGTGLGLSICRDIAGRMNAKVYLDTSYTGGGARFVFAVPTQSETPDSEAKQPAL